MFSTLRTIALIAGLSLLTAARPSPAAAETHGNGSTNGRVELDFQETPPGAEEAGLFDQPVFNQFVTLSVKDADIQNVIRLISARTGLNILMDPNEVSGKITLHLDNVRLGDALDNILKVNKLAFIVEEGNILRIVPESRVGRRQVETQTVVVELSWRNAIDIEKTFSPFLSEHGSMRANEESQSLIITDVPPNIERIKQLIRQVDRAERQVIINARLVDIQIAAARALEVNWGLSKINDARPPIIEDPFSSGSSDGGTSIFAPSVGLLGSGGTVGGVSPVGVEGFGFAGGVGTLQFGSTIGVLGDDYNLDATITNLETRGVVEIIANPRVTTLNNVPANIEIIQKIPFIEAVSGPSGDTITNEVEFERAGVNITVKPIITPGKDVRLDMDLIQRIFRGRVGTNPLDPPLIDERNAHTTVIVQDRNTVMLGGLKELRDSENIEGMPWLHRIPFFGHWFKNKNNDQQKSELVLMVKPEVVHQALINDREKELSDRLELNWHRPDYYFDDVQNIDDEKINQRQFDRGDE